MLTDLLDDLWRYYIRCLIFNFPVNWTCWMSYFNIRLNVVHRSTFVKQQKIFSGKHESAWSHSLTCWMIIGAMINLRMLDVSTAEWSTHQSTFGTFKCKLASSRKLCLSWSTIVELLANGLILRTWKDSQIIHAGKFTGNEDFFHVFYLQF